MRDWTEELINDCEKTYCLKIKKDGIICIVAFTTTKEDAHRIMNEFGQEYERAVIEEYENADITFSIDVKKI